MREETIYVPPRQTLNAFSGNVEHQLDEGFRVVEHRLDDTAPPKSGRSAGGLHPGTPDELVPVPPRQAQKPLPPLGTSSTSSMKGFGLSSTRSTTQPAQAQA